MIRFEPDPGLKRDVSMDELRSFNRALGIAKPWLVVALKFSKEEGRLDL